MVMLAITLPGWSCAHAEIGGLEGQRREPAVVQRLAELVQCRGVGRRGVLRRGRPCPCRGCSGRPAGSARRSARSAAAAAPPARSATATAVGGRRRRGRRRARCGIVSSLQPLSPSAATIVTALRTAAQVRCTRVDQPAAESNARADALEICQPLGLGPATNWTFCGRGRANGGRCGDVGGGHAALLVDVGDVEAQRELALARPRCCTPGRRRCPRSCRCRPRCRSPCRRTSRPRRAPAGSAAAEPANLAPVPAASGCPTRPAARPARPTTVLDAMEVTPAAAAAHQGSCCHAGNEGFQGHGCPFDRPNSSERLTVLLVCRIPTPHTKAESPVALKLLLHQLPVREGAQHE